MSYAIIRNTKYKRQNLQGIYRHNERRNKNYSNKNIDMDKTYLNYSIKIPKFSYEKEFDLIREKYNLKGQIKVVSNIACEYIITSDNDFFNSIGTKETKRYFETAYKFVCEYKNLGEQYIISANVHMDEETPHMHIIFLPIIHTVDKKGNNIEKIACSEFWKEKDSYRMLQNAFYEYIISHGFKLQRGLLKEETNRQHLSLKEYKEITNFNKTKEKLENITLQLPNVPNIEDINVNRLSKKRDEKILTEIIQPKDNLINKLYQENLILQEELSRKSKIFKRAEKYEQERKNILEYNEELQNTVEHLELKYKNKNKKLDADFKNRQQALEENFKEKVYKLNNQYEKKYRKLEKENNRLYRIIDKFYEILEKFIKWICYKIDVSESNQLIKNFQEEANTLIDPVKQLDLEEKIKDDEEEEM